MINCYIRKRSSCKPYPTFWIINFKQIISIKNLNYLINIKRCSIIYYVITRKIDHENLTLYMYKSFHVTYKKPIYPGIAGIWYKGIRTPPSPRIWKVICSGIITSFSIHVDNDKILVYRSVFVFSIWQSIFHKYFNHETNCIRH